MYSLEQKVFGNISGNLHIKWGSLCIMYANVCTLSLFLTCGPYALLPAWAGENSPECFILVNKQHEDACQVLRAPCQSPLLHLGSIRRRTPSVAAAASRRRVATVFTALWLPAVTDDTAASAHTEDTSVTQQDLNAPRTHTLLLHSVTYGSQIPPRQRGLKIKS